VHAIGDADLRFTQAETRSLLSETLGLKLPKAPPSGSMRARADG
jgi:ATP/maltotriose-dependent transcriptional regulator MalT